MKNLAKAAGLLVTVILFQALSGAGQNKDSGAKALFYDPSTGNALNTQEKRRKSSTGTVKVKQAKAKADQAKNRGLQYWIDLDGVGRVTEDHIFRTGDKIRLRFRSNMDGYLSIWSLDSSGHGYLLFPAPGQIEMEPYIKAGTEYTLPGMIKFSPPIEDERLLVFFSYSKADTPLPIQKQASAEMVASSIKATGSKALVFETEKENPSEVASYVIHKDGGTVIKEIRLRHHPLNR